MSNKMPKQRVEAKVNKILKLIREMGSINYQLANNEAVRIKTVVEANLENALKQLRVENKVEFNLGDENDS